MANAYRALTAEQTLELLSVPAHTCILFHVNPDADAICSAFGLAAFLESMGSRCYCLCAEEIPERLRFLTEGIQQSVLTESSDFLPRVAERIQDLMQSSGLVRELSLAQASLL